MATFGSFADLSQYQNAQARAALQAAQPANSLEAAIQGYQQAQAVRNLPNQQLAQQLASAIAQQQLFDLQNPNAKLLRDAQSQLALKSLDPTSGVISVPTGLESEIIQTPGALTPQAQAALIAGGVQPVIAPGAAIQPFTIAGQPTGFSQDLSSAIAATEALSRAKGTTSLERQMLANEQARARLLSEEQRAREANISRETIAKNKPVAGKLTQAQELSQLSKAGKFGIDVEQFRDTTTGQIDWPSVATATGKAEGEQVAAMNVIRSARTAQRAGHPTASQEKFQIYGNRMDQADKILNNLDAKGFDPTSLGTGGLVGSWSPNLLKSSERQQFEGAQRNFINAILRDESGAVISESEFENARAQYFPQPGDSQETIDQKKDMRKLVIDEFRRLGGQTPPTTPQTAPAASVGGQSSAEAIQWANTHKNDPRAARILKANGL